MGDLVLSDVKYGQCALVHVQVQECKQGEGSVELSRGVSCHALCHITRCIVLRDALCLLRMV